MAAKKKSLQQLAALAVEEVKRGPGRPKGSKGRGKKKAAKRSGGSRGCDPLAEVKKAAALIRKTKAAVSGLDVGSIGRVGRVTKKRKASKKK